MNKLFIILLICLAALSTQAQQNIQANRINVFSNLGIPIQDTVGTPYKIGEIRVRPGDSLAYRFNGLSAGKKWNRVAAIDSAYALNDSTFRIILNGKNNDIKIRGNTIGSGNYYTTSGTLNTSTQQLILARNSIGTLPIDLTGIAFLGATNNFTNENTFTTDLTTLKSPTRAIDSTGWGLDFNDHTGFNVFSITASKFLFSSTNRNNVVMSAAANYAISLQASDTVFLTSPTIMVNGGKLNMGTSYESVIPKLSTDPTLGVQSGSIYYNTSTNKFRAYDGTWKDWGIAGTNWSLTGNTGTIDGTSFIGTSDNIPINFRVNNVSAGRIGSNGNQTYYGYQAGNSTNGIDVTAIGYQTLQNNTGSYNTGVGYKVLNANTTGNGNDAFGFRALISNTGGLNNTALGHDAMNMNQIGSNNVAVGYDANWQNVNGNYNVAVGQAALNSNVVDSNTAVGNEAAHLVTTGKANTIIGAEAGNGLTTGSYNTIIGANSTVSATFNNSVLITNGKGVQRLLFDNNGNLQISVQQTTSDTTTYKPTVMDNSGNIRQATNWSGGVGRWILANASNTSDYTVTTATMVFLPDLTGQANHIVTLPSSPLSGDRLILKNKNTDASGFTWSTSAAIVLGDGSTITTLTNKTVYSLVYDVSSGWNIVN